MKKLFLSLLSLVVSMAMFAQSNVRKMNLIYDGQVVYSRAVSLIDSIKFVWSDGSGSGDDITGGEVDPSKQLYVGVVAFNRDVRQMAITSDMEAVKAFINEQTNDKDFTAFAYSVSQGNKQFDAAGLPEFDNIFMLNFSDGTDNYSNMKWGEEGRNVPPSFVYDTARYDLLQRTGLNSYAIGFGNDVGFGEKMKKVVTGSGGYYNAKSSNDLQPTFNEIAKSMLASAKNVLLKTNPGYYSGYYKYFRFKFTAEGGYSDVIYAQMDGTPTNGYTLAISKIDNGYAYFDAPAKGVVDDETGKVHIPLNNLKFVKDGKELQYKYTIEVSFDGELYYEDVEEASTAEEISKRIAVVLVLDCSTSMGDAFAPMKAAAIDFIKTMEKMEVDDSEPNIPDPNPDGDEVLGEGATPGEGETPATKVTFDFTTAEGLEALGIAYPETTTSTDGAFCTDLEEGKTYTQEGVSLTAKHGSTATRVWLAASGAMDLRHYKNGVLTIAAPAGYTVVKIELAGGNVVGFENMSDNVWQGMAATVALTATANASTIKIKTITVTLAEAD